MAAEDYDPINYSGIPFDPTSGMHCWGLVQKVYRDHTGVTLKSFDYSHSKANSDAILLWVQKLPICEPRDLAGFVLRCNGDHTVGIISNRYAIFMTANGSRVVLWTAIARSYNPACYKLSPLENIELYG